MKRKHPSETADSAVVKCPKCNGTGKNRFGNPCGSAEEDQGGCAGGGIILQQRRDANGNPIRVELDA